MRTYLCDKFGNAKDESRFNLYIQKVTLIGMKTYTVALVLGMDLDQQDVGSKVIANLMFNKEFQKIVVHYFTMQNSMPNDVVLQKFQDYNTYQQNNTKIVIHGIPNDNELVDLSDGKKYSAKRLLLSPLLNKWGTPHSASKRYRCFYFMYDVEDKAKVEEEQHLIHHLHFRII